MNAHETVCLVQARSGSFRLPGKVFRTLPATGPGLSILEHCIRRLEKADVGPVYALIPHNDEPMQEFLEKHSISFIAGPLDDVRARFDLAGRVTGARYLVRATADNPCVDPDFVRRSVERIKQTGADLFAFGGLPLGCAVEVFTARSLECRHGPEKEDPPEYREHVSLHIKHHPEHYRVIVENAGLPDRAAAMRLTVDEDSDYTVVQQVFELGGVHPVNDVLSADEFQRVAAAL